MAKDTIIECVDLDLGYGQTPILQNIDLQITRGEIVTIFGGSGSGKSTLLRCIVGLLPPQRGTVRLFGEELYALGARERSRLLARVGMLFQNGALLGSMSVLENVMLPLRELFQLSEPLPEPVMAEMARTRLALMGLHGMENRRPAELSGGQRKRAALARASILDPEIIFCDEPTSGLDPVMSGAVDDLLLRFRDALGITIVIITHDMASVRAIADRALMVGEGRLLAQGSLEQLANSREPRVHEFFARFSPEPRSQPPRDLQRRMG